MFARIQSFFSSDRLNPIILKEVRQGTRSKAFLLNFLVAQIGMVLLVIVMLGEVNEGGASAHAVREMNQLFWMLFGLFLLVGIPLSGINAISNERAEGRLDLLHLTRLSALKIVRGKWLAIFTQALVVTVSLFPYVTVRYFVGSVNVVDDLIVIGSMLLASGFITGYCVCVSSMRSVILRWLIVGLSLWFLLFVGGSILVEFLMRRHSFFGMPGTSAGAGIGWGIAVIITQSIIIFTLAMEFAASVISPPAENHQTRIRLLYILQMVLTLLAVFFLGDVTAGFCLMITLGTGVVVCASALVQLPVPLPSIYVPFVRFGRIGKLLGSFLLYPGFSSGFYFLIFSLLVMFAGSYIFVFEHTDDVEYLLLSIPSIVGCFLVPMAVALMRSRSKYSLFVRFLFGCIVLLVLGLLCMALSHQVGSLLSYFFILDPYANLFMLFDQDIIDFDAYLYAAGSCVVSGLSIVYIFVKGMHWRRRERELENAAVELYKLKEVEPA